MAKKYYAVKVGKVCGLFTDWNECKNSIDGYPGAQFKGFGRKADALAYLGQSESDETDKPTPKPHCAIAYVDGSFNAKTGEFAYGAVLFVGDEVKEYNGAYKNDKVSSMRNVAGELKGAMMMMSLCVKNNIRELELHYDYEGIEKWCTGAWKANLPGTRMYRDYYNSIKDKIKVTFVKVKGHSGDIYNDRADSLAKGALGID